MTTPNEAVDPTPIVTLPTEPIQIDPAKIHGLGAFTSSDPDQQGRICWFTPNAKVFLVHNKSTVEVRTDAELANLLTDKYESVMRSRYFGAGGIEIVLSGQLSQSEIEDLVRLSYNLTLEH